ncbi:MAG: family 10 glycosylhydrolase [Cyanobacteria bacterium P01_F01_bin.4]
MSFAATPALSVDPQSSTRAEGQAVGGQAVGVPFAAPDVAPNALDPSEQIAPPGLDIQPGEPITPSLATAMRQELENLMGRFESALLIANSVDQPSQLSARQTAGTLTASVGPVGIGEATTMTPALALAQQLLEDWSGLLARKDNDTVRSRWLNARRALWAEFPMRSVAQPEIRAVWLDRGTLVRARSRQGLARIFDRLSAAGINTVFVETVNAGYPIYPSRVAPQQNPLTRSWDPLAAAVDLGKSHDIEVHAWVWTFAAGNQAHNRLLNQPADYMGPVLNVHPTWANYDNRGEMLPLGQTKPFLDPANPEVRSYLLRLLNEIAGNYDVAGIHLDYIRYPFQDPGANRTYGYGLASRQQFQRMTGTDPVALSPRDNPQLWSRWTQFRTQQVSSFVADASQTLKRLRPELIVSTAVFAQPTHERLQKLQQDWESWARQGSVDWIVLMSYAADTQRFSELIRPWVVEANYGSTLVIPGIRLNTSRMAALDQIRALRDLPTTGYALFAAEYLDQGLQSALNAIQGPSATLRSQPIPQQRPFAAAVARYQTLQREWNWLLSHQQLQMDERNLQELVREANALGEELDGLSGNASHRDLVRVRSRLDRLRTQLNTDMTVRTASRRYRLRAWQHRLSTIERLLAYGESRS